MEDRAHKVFAGRGEGGACGKIGALAEGVIVIVQLTSALLKSDNPAAAQTARYTPEVYVSMSSASSYTLSRKFKLSGTSWTAMFRKSTSEFGNRFMVVCLYLI